MTPAHRIVLGTKNKDKLRELQKLVGRSLRVLSLADFPSCKDVRETGRTFAANARLKARAYSLHTRLLTLADDSGLMVARLRGAPGVYSARFAGPGCTYADNNRKLLRLLKHLPPSKRKAKFVSVIAVYANGKFLKAVRGECEGTIAYEAKGVNGFGYDPVFMPNGHARTYAQMPPALKNSLSHRGKALKKAKKFILSYLKKAKA